MRDFCTYKGHFKLDVLDKKNRIIDTIEDPNMIMTAASSTMAGIFFGNTLGSMRFSLGTHGHVDPNILVPKVAADGFVNTRDRMFSESLSSPGNPTTIGTIISINKGDVIYCNGAIPGYYEYTGSLGTSNVTHTVTDAGLAISADWVSLGTTAPYVYDITFNNPTTTVDTTLGDIAVNIQETDLNAGSTVRVLLNNNSVTFNVVVELPAANSQTLTLSTFTEAALYVGTQIFSLKTFPAKIKDNSVKLQIAWTITF